MARYAIRPHLGHPPLWRCPGGISRAAGVGCARALCLAFLVWANLFHTFGRAGENFLFLTFIFTFAMLFSWLAIWQGRTPVDKAAVWRGFVLGIPNFFATFFLLESLKSPLFADRSAVVYSVYSVAGVVLVFAAGTLVWREPVTYRSALGVLIAVCAIILLKN